LNSTHTIPSREEILGIFRSAKAPLDLRTLALSLKVKADSQAVLTRRLNAMERDGQIRSDTSGFYVLADHSEFIAGRVSSHRDGYGFLIPDEPGEDLFLAEREMQKVLHGDKVLGRITGYDRRGRPEGTIVEVVQRGTTHIIGRLLKENGAWVVAPEDKRISQDILVQGAVGKAKSGQIVSVELTEQPGRFKQPSGKIVEVLGDMDDPGMEIEIAVRKFGVPHIFSDAALKQAARLPDVVHEADWGERVDLRDVPLVTIDGEDARDFDDAVYCEPVKVGRSKAFRLIVAIADVSHYVKPNDGLDGDAIERSTSVYFPRRVIPMLPEKLSNGLCSLNPRVDRLTLVCDAVITAQGELKAYQFYPAVIHSAARLTYTEVAAILGNTKGPEAARRAEIVPHLQNLYDVYHALQKSRQERGAIDFETTETYIVCNPAGKIEKIIPRTRNDAHKLIEECMLAANVCAADLLLRHKHPGTYRIHAGPTKEKLTQVRDFLKQLGLSLGGGDTPVARDYADLMKKIKERPDAQLLQTMLLRSMQQAVYSPDNIGHFGLAYEAYAHFTSPIRRYPDLLTHRAIKAILAGKKYEPKIADKSVLNTTISNAQRRQALKDKQEGKEQKSKGDHSIWDALGVHCSANERRADEASRDVEAWLKCYFMQDKLGEEFSGIITGVTNFGIFVQLDQLFVEGLVHITDLGTDFFEYDDARHELRGQRTGKRYQLTGRVNVQVVRVDLESRKIDLRLADSEISTLPPQSKKGSRKGGGLVGSLGDFDSFDDEGDKQAVARKRKAAARGAEPSIPSREEAPTRAPGRSTSKRGAASSAYAPPAPAARKAAKPKSRAKPKTTAKAVTKAAKPKKKR
jgi:ribonuclease R